MEQDHLPTEPSGQADAQPTKARTSLARRILRAVPAGAKWFIRPVRPFDPPATRLDRCRKFMSHIPRAVVAIFLLAPLLWLDYKTRSMPYGGGSPFWWWIERNLQEAYVVVIFLAGAVQRLSWRHAVVMLLPAGLLLGFAYLSRHLNIYPEGYYPHLHVIWSAVFVLFLGAGELLTTGRLSWRAMAWLVGCAVAAGAAWNVISQVIDWQDWHITTGYRLGSTEGFAPHFLLTYPLLACVTWTAVAGAALAAQARRAGKIALASAAVLCIAGHIFFWEYAVFAMARQSLHGQGYIDKAWAIYFLTNSRQESDWQLALDEVLAADWSKPPTPYRVGDWRSGALYALFENPRLAPKAAAAITDMIRRRPHHALVEYSALLLAQQRQCRAAPIFVRFAPTALSFRHEYTRALEEMRIPEAALLLLWFEYVGPVEGKVPLSQHQHDRLTALLGVDYGSTFEAWMENVDSAVAKAPSPLDAQTQRELRREIALHERFIDAKDRWEAAVAGEAEKRIRRDGRGHLLDAIEVFVLNATSPTKNVPREIVEADGDFVRDFRRAAADMAVDEPDLAVGIDDFEAEVAAYEKRVNEVIARFLGTAATTTSSPATAPAAIEELVKAAHGPDGLAREKAVGQLLDHLRPGMTLLYVQMLLGPPAQLTEGQASGAATLTATYYAWLEEGSPLLIKGSQGRRFTFGEGQHLMTVDFERPWGQWLMTAIRGPHIPDAPAPARQ